MRKKTETRKFTMNYYITGHACFIISDITPDCYLAYNDSIMC